MVSHFPNMDHNYAHYYVSNDDRFESLIELSLSIKVQKKHNTERLIEFELELKLIIEFEILYLMENAIVRVSIYF